MLRWPALMAVQVTSRVNNMLKYANFGQNHSIKVKSVWNDGAHYTEHNNTPIMTISQILMECGEFEGSCGNNFTHFMAVVAANESASFPHSCQAPVYLRSTRIFIYVVPAKHKLDKTSSTKTCNGLLCQRHFLFTFFPVIIPAHHFHLKWRLSQSSETPTFVFLDKTCIKLISLCCSDATWKTCRGSTHASHFYINIKYTNIMRHQWLLT